MNKSLEIILDKSKNQAVFAGATYLLKDQIKALPGAKWNFKEKFWSVPLSQNGLEDLKLHFPQAKIIDLDKKAEQVSEPDEVNTGHLSVSSLLDSIKGVLDRAFPADLKVCGVVRGLKALDNGRVYLDLYDLESKSCHLRAVIWESRASYLMKLREEGFSLEAELPILVEGRVSASSINGSLSFVINRIYPEYTKGKLAAQRDKTNLKLKEEGLFNLNKNLTLKSIPKNLGILTSKGGTVINDFLSSLSAAEFGFNLKWCSVRVQGQYAVGDLIKGISYFNEIEEIDAILVFRGGGSVGDLQVFNEYALAKAVCLSKKPILSAIGHEFDQSSFQDVSNIAFGVPKDLGHFLAKRILDFRQAVKEFANYIFTNSQTTFNKYSKDLAYVSEAIFRIPKYHVDTLFKSLTERYFNLFGASRYRLVQGRQQLKSVSEPLLGLSIRRSMEGAKDIERYEAFFSVVSPEVQLRRGFAIVRDKNGIVVGSKGLKVEQELEIEMIDGSVKSKILEVK